MLLRSMQYYDVPDTSLSPLAAYEVLGDDEKRQAFDAFGH